MRRLFLLALLAVAPLWGQGTIGSLQCIKRDRAVIMRWVISPAISNDAARCKYDYDTVSLDRQNKQVNATSANAGRRQCVIYDLAPDDDVYLGPQTSDSTKTLWSPLLTCSNACTNCGPGDASFFASSSGCDCGAAGEYPKVHTDLEDTDPAPDPPVSTGRTTPPTITGATYTVAGDCSDFATKKASAEADAADGDVVALVLPAGVACTTSGFNLTSIANGGWVVVKSSADPKLLPPAGSLTDKTYLPFLGVITWSQKGQWGYNDELITVSDNARGYYFENINLGPPALNSSILDPVTVTISSIDVATDTITVPSTVGLLQQGSFGANGSGEVVVLNLAGTSVRGGYGPMHACNVTATTFQLYTGVTHKGCFGGTLVNLTGSNCTGGSCGTVRRFIALPIESFQDCGGSECLTITGHGIPNFPNMTITGATTSTITVSGTPGEYQIGSNTVVHVEGTGSGTCDGLRNSTVSGSVLTLSRTGQTTDCSSVTTGTVHRHRAVSIFRSNNDTLGDHEPRAHNVERVDANTLKILELSHQSGASGGYLFWDMESLGNVIELGRSARAQSVEDVVFDRIISQACLPWLSQGWGSFGNSQHVSLVNSYIEHCMWQRVNPVNGQTERIHGLFQAPVTIFRGTEDLQIRNNYYGPQGFLFADDDSSAPDTHVDDLSITGNYLWNPDWTVKNAGVWRNHFFTRSFPLELKSAGTRLAISGNYFKGWLSDFQQTAPAIALSLNGSNSDSPNGPSQVAMEYNIFDRGASILQLVSDLSSGRTANKWFNFTEKIRLANNLAVHIDTVKYTANPSNASGLFVQASTGYRDFVIERNTFAPERAVFPRILELGNHRSSGMRLTNNILGFTEGSDTNRVGFAQAMATGQIPAETEDGGYAAFQEFHVRGTATDPLSSVSGNIAIPMLKQSSSGTYAVKAASADPADTHCQSSMSTMDKMLNIPLTYVGNTNNPCDQSLSTRLDLTFQPGVWTPTATYSGKGADLTALADAQGMPGPVTVTADDTSVTISFHAPTTAACPVDLAPWAGSWAATWDNAGDITRAQDPSPDQEQVVTFTGLTAETEYAYRGHCRRGFVGQVTTAGTPLAFLPGFYVDAVNGDDDNDGTSPGQAWQTIAKLNGATFSAGDEIYLRKGQRWREQLTFPSSGSSGNPITVTGYGTGANPILDGSDIFTGWTDAGSNRWTKATAIFPEKVWFDGIRGTEAASQAAVDAPNEWFWGSNVLTVFSTSDPATAFISPGVEVPQRERALLVNGKSWLVFDGIDLRKAWGRNAEFFGAGSTDIEFRNAEVLDGGQGGVIVISDNFWFHDNYVARNGDETGTAVGHGIYPGLDAGIKANNWIIEDNEFDSNARAGIHCHLCGVPGRARRNYVHDNGEWGIIISTVVAGDGVGTGGITVNNNLSIDNGEAGLQVNDSDGSADFIAFINNTSARNGEEGFLNFNNGAGANIALINNLFYENVLQAAQSSGSGTWAYLNNGYYRSATGNMISYSGLNYSNAQFASYQSATGQDANGFSADPEFVDPAGDNFRLQTGAPGIDTGFDHDDLDNPSVYDINLDLALVAIPQGAGRDIGAYEAPE